jgi:argininosuccinate lyase
MNKMSVSEFKKIDARFEEDIVECFDYEKSVEMRSAPGGTARKCILEQVAVLKKALA